MNFFRTMVAIAVLCAVVPVYTKDKKKEAEKKALVKKEADRKSFAKKEAEKRKAEAKKAKRQVSVVNPQQPAVKKQQPILAKQQQVVMPAVIAQPAGPVKKLNMDIYLNNKVTSLQGNLINDIFPKKGTIERIVLEFKDEYPGPDKEGDTALIYETIINNPAIKSMITLKNAVSVYKFIRETIDNVWTRQDELIWAR